MADAFLYVGTYTTGGGEGIYLFLLHRSNGTLIPRSIFRDTQEPSFLALHPALPRLYAVNELIVYEGKSDGSVSAFDIHKDGSLALLGRQSSHGAGPCHVSLSRDARHLFVANYAGSTLAVLPLSPEGDLQPASTVFRHQGQGHDLERQDAPHMHCGLADPDNRRVLAVDLGLDTVSAYAFDPPGEDPEAVLHLAPGTGPRQLAFHPGGRWAYVVNELKPQLLVLAYDAATARFTPIEIQPLLPLGFSGPSYGAHVQATPDGRFVYASNRRHDSLAAWSVDRETGRLSLIGHFSTLGTWPRHFVIDPAGDFLIVANQRSHTLVVFRIERESGVLTPTGQALHVPSPVCLQVRELP